MTMGEFPIFQKLEAAFRQLGPNLFLGEMVAECHGERVAVFYRVGAAAQCSQPVRDRVNPSKISGRTGTDQKGEEQGRSRCDTTSQGMEETDAVPTPRDVHVTAKADEEAVVALAVLCGHGAGGSPIDLTEEFFPGHEPPVAFHKLRGAIKAIDPVARARQRNRLPAAPSSSNEERRGGPEIGSDDAFLPRHQTGKVVAFRSVDVQAGVLERSELVELRIVEQAEPKSPVERIQTNR